MILFDNWTISVIGLVARQYDNLSRRIDVEGDLPDGYTWQLLVQSGGNADTLLLQPTENGAGVVLTADNLSKSGEYYFQLRGVLKADGVTKRHTNVVSAHIPKSLTGVGNWPEVPTEFYQVEANILELYQHPPIPGSNGYWLVWDADKDEYVESQLALPEVSVGPPGPDGYSPTVALTETSTGVQITIQNKDGTQSATVFNGKDGAPGADGQAATLEITGAEALPAGSTPAVVEQEGSTAQARRYLLKIPSGKDGENGKDGSDGKDGAPGEAATVTISRIDLLAYGAAPTITELEGSTAQSRVYAIGLPAGKPGDKGDPGASPTVAVYRNETDTGAVITVTNADGSTTSVEIADGATYTLPVASETTLGGVKPIAKTDAMTQSVGVDADGALWAPPGSGGGGSSSEAYSVEYTTGEMTEDVDLVRLNITDNDMWRKIINADYIKIDGTVIKPSDGTTTGKVSFGLASSAINSAMSLWVKYFDNQSILPSGKGLFNVKFGGFLDPKIADSDISYNGDNSRNAVASVYTAVNNGGVKISNVPTTLRLGVFRNTSFLLTCTTQMGAGTVFTVTAIKE